MIAPVFCSEYGGVDNIILTSKYGRTKCSEAKVGAGLIAAFIVRLAVVAANLLFAFVLYGKEGLDCSILLRLCHLERYIFLSISPVEHC